MDNNIIDRICNQVYKKFPEVAGAVPKITAQPMEGPYANFLLSFRGCGTTEDGHQIQRLVRVVASEKGKIVKITTSR